MYLLILLGLLAGVSVLALVAVLFFRHVWKRTSRLRGAIISSALLLFTLSYLLLAFEAYFYVGAQPDGFGFTLASKRWSSLYWKPVNSRGLRDVEHPPESFIGKRVLYVLGDSFAAGSGIEDYRDRFSGVLAERLGEGWTVVTIARGGWDTARQLSELKAYPYTPDIVVLQYFVNDIKHAALSHGLPIHPPLPPPPTLIKPLVEHSYLADFLFWRGRRSNMRAFTRAFWDQLAQYYDDPDLWHEHEQALRAFAGYTRKKRIDLYVVIFPDLARVVETRTTTAKVARVFQELGVPVLDLAPILVERDPVDMIVSTFNAHPNPALSREVGDLLYEGIAAAFPKYGLPNT